VAISAEKGYSREAGNLLFHVSLLVALVLIAAGRLLSYQGSIVLTEGSGFCNTTLAYDSFRAGRSVNKGGLAPFCVDRLNSFTATYRDDGSPAQFKADISYSEGLTGKPQHDVITVNHPLRLKGDRIYLINHGFAPTVTITRPGVPPRELSTAFLPQDGFLTSEGAIKYQGPGIGHDIGIQGLFAPTPVDQGGGVISSVSPQAKDPVLAIFAYTGDLGLNGGQPQSVYALDQQQITSGKLTKVAAKNLTVGQAMTLPDGTVIRFDGFKQWASMQVSHDPTQTALLVAAVLMVSGLLGSLVVRRRRVWLRLSSPEPGSRTLVEVGGLARNDSGNFTAEFESLIATLRTALDSGPLDIPAATVPVPVGKD
jgi:cytochrome c biogenesis protein